MQVETVYVDSNAMDRAVKDHCKNLEMLGSGLYGRVFGANSTPHVVKIMRAHDRGYRAWAEVCQAFAQDNSYMPKIIRAVQYIARDSSPEHEKGYAPTDCMVFYIEALSKNVSYSSDRRIRRSTGFYRVMQRLSDILYSLQQDEDQHGFQYRLEQFRPVHRDMLAMLLLAKSQCENRVFDLHCGNAMMRGRQLVIVDPLC